MKYYTKYFAGWLVYAKERMSAGVFVSKLIYFGVSDTNKSPQLTFHYVVVSSGFHAAALCLILTDAVFLLI